MTTQPNILLLFSDEHSFRYLGALSRENGGEDVDTPNLDRLINRGTWFTDAYCQMPLCTPSRISMLCGKEVRNCGAWTNNSVLRPELNTIPRVLSKAGYETCLVGKMHLGGNQQFAGFHRRPYGDLTGKTGHQWEPLDNLGGRGMRSRTEDAGVTELPDSLTQDRVVATETVSFIREQSISHPDRPWFACASFSRPHFPYTVPPRFLNRYLGKFSKPPVAAGGDAHDHPMTVGMRKGFRCEEITEDECAKARAAYAGCVSYLDEVIGDLLDSLEKDGHLDNTIIIYTTDHGEMAGEHGLWYKNGWFDGCTRVPFIISMPWQRQSGSAASVVDTPVGIYDIFPTLCAQAGVDIPADLDGTDLSPVLSDDTSAARSWRDLNRLRPVYCDALTPRWGAGTEFRSIRRGHYKYIVFRDAPALFFDLQDDPGEQHNLLIHDMTADDREAMETMKQIAAESIDFEEAEREWKERDGELHTMYSLSVPQSTPNLYHLPSGKIVDADSPLYTPNIIAQDAAYLGKD